MNRTWIATGLGIALVAVLGVVAVPALRGDDRPHRGRHAAVAPSERRAVGTRGLDLKHLPKPAYQRLMERPARPIGPGSGTDVALQDARRGVADGVRGLVTDLKLGDADAAKLDALRAEAEASLDALQAEVAVGDVVGDAVRARLERVRTKLVEGAVQVLGPARADAVAAHLGSAAKP